MGQNWPKKGCVSKNGKNLYQKAHNSTEYGMVVWYWNQFCRNIWNKIHPSVYSYEIMAIFANFPKNSIFRHKRMSTMSFIWYQNSKSVKKHLLQHFMAYCAQSCQNKTSIVPNWHSSLHMKLLLLFGGHLSIVRYLINFLRLHDTRTTTLIGNGN